MIRSSLLQSAVIIPQTTFYLHLVPELQVTLSNQIPFSPLERVTLGSFFYLSKAVGPDLEDILQTSRQQFNLADFPRPTTFETDAYIVDYYPKIANACSNCVTFSNENFIFSVGTFLYRGQIGRRALELFFEQTNHLQELRNCSGHFAFDFKKNGETHLFRDAMGSQEVFLTRAFQCVTSSFLAAANAAPRCSISEQEMYEYVFNGACLGTGTPVKEVTRLDLFERMTLDKPPSIIRERVEVCPEEARGTVFDLIDHSLQTLLDYTSELVALFGTNVSLALSGGYDSKLLLGLFRRSGSVPHLFVYGSSEDLDVRISRHIAEVEGINIRHLNKSILCQPQPEQYPDVVRKNYFREDGIDADGIFNSGAEQFARAERTKNDALHVNGGGGEIYRNFFYLLDRGISAREFVWCFYSQFDPVQCANRFNVNEYEAAIARKVLDVFDLRNNSLSRRQIECLYPYFRCRSWFGRENSVNNRYGYSVLPFFDYRIVSEALQIPIRYKHFGNFESALIQRANSVLANYPSSYGYGFGNKTPLISIVGWLFTYLRPLWLRRYSFRIKERLRNQEQRPALLSERYLREVIDTRFPHMFHYFKMGSITSNLHFARICTLEYLYTQLSVT